MTEPLTERERLVLAWDKGPEEWYAKHGGQYGAELVDAERKARAWDGRCALENVKDEPRCHQQCANCQALDEETKRLVDLEIAKLGRPGPGW